MKRKNFFDNVGDNTHSVAERGRDALHQAGDLVAELGDALAPKAQKVANQVGPKARDLADNVHDFVDERGTQLRKQGARLASDTRSNLQPYLDQAADRVQPYVDEARDRIQPLVDTGRKRLEKDVLPRINDALNEVAQDPRSQEAARRLNAARLALAGEIDVPTTKKQKRRSVVGTVLKVVLAAGLLSAVVFAVKKLLAPADSGWQAHEPSAGYRVDPSTFGTSTTTAADTVDDKGGDSLDAKDDKPAAAPTTTGDADRSDLDGSLEGESDPFVVSPYGEGSYVGNEPPEGFAIKGNERSMKYHVQGKDGYDRTIADVWFNSEEAAQAAGFTKAQR
ncbi:sunset domain-containing protein [Nigerium massiliense]|uniref:sunset domain-containing protein n=1 Tax=Nigerium massiliense TaxID=1522317 RepID=UPI00058D4CDC|nr:DUF5324 family protein [Nigerium massiliense]